MLKRLLLILLASILSLGASVGTASAQSQKDSSQSSIWRSLWEGANLDFSSLTRSDQNNNDRNNRTATYVALGDSVAAGLGLGSESQCGRSAAAYPHQVTATTKLQLVHLACSGATAGDLFTQQRVSGPNIAPQLDRAFAGGTPRLISITAGANDVHWNDYFLWKCYNSTCGTDFDETIADGYLTAYKLKLHYLFNDISLRSNGQLPRVVITGYYAPLSSRCASQQENVTSKEIRWLNRQARAINSAIRDVVKYYDFVKYASVSFSGHGICSSDPWVQGPNDPAPFHPTAKGQEVIAKSVIRAADID